MILSREHRLIDAFVDIADALVTEYDVVDLLDTLVSHCCGVLGAQDAGILLASARGALEVVASSNERSRLIGLMEVGAGEGPCVEAFETGQTISARGYAEIYAKWPTFAVGARDEGYAAAHAIPLRLRSATIGSLNLFLDDPAGLSDDDLLAARGLADVATIGILHERALRESTIAQEQLEHALNSRVLIEQAKGIIAHTERVDMDEAFRRLRDRARSTSARMTEVARDLIDHSVGAGHPAS